MKIHPNRTLSALALGVVLGLLGSFALSAMPAGAQAQDKHSGGAMPHGSAKKMGAAPPMAMKDERLALTLSPDETIFVLGEMRAFLESVQGIVDGVAQGNMKDVAAAARKSGRAALAHAPRTLMTKLPKEFRMLGGDTHKKFDALAAEANQMGDKAKILKQLSTLLSNCTSCHATFRFSAK